MADKPADNPKPPVGAGSDPTADQAANPTGAMVPADWAAVVALADGSAGPNCSILVSTGEPPEPVWLAAFLNGSSSSTIATTGDAGPDDVAFAMFPVGGIALVLGRDGKSFRARERRQLLALARVAGVRWSELTGERTINPGSLATS